MNFVVVDYNDKNINNIYLSRGEIPNLTVQVLRFLSVKTTVVKILYLAGRVECCTWNTWVGGWGVERIAYLNLLSILSHHHSNFLLLLSCSFKTSVFGVDSIWMVRRELLTTSSLPYCSTGILVVGKQLYSSCFHSNRLCSPVGLAVP